MRRKKSEGTKNLGKRGATVELGLDQSSVRKPGTRISKGSFPRVNIIHETRRWRCGSQNSKTKEGAARA